MGNDKPKDNDIQARLGRVRELLDRLFAADPDAAERVVAASIQGILANGGTGDHEHDEELIRLLGELERRRRDEPGNGTEP